MKFLYRFLLLSIIATICVECAKKGRPTGGKKDEKAPIMVVAKPPYGTVNFNKKEIRIYFDEYIVLKNLTNQLIISPPLKKIPTITPQGTASKYIKIKVTDTLRPNTTYTFNFGNAVQDNNENNKLEQFKYVFSTGNLIDSLKIKGKVAVALEDKPKKNLSVLLYKLDSTYNDSVPYKKKPDYVAKTIDSVHYQFTNIKEGNYKVIALDQKIDDYVFNPRTDKVGFLLDTISLPKDSVINKTITVFSENKPFKFKQGIEVSKGKIQFKFTGNKKGFKVQLISSVPSYYKAFEQFEKNRDTLNYWFTPIKQDSLNFLIRKDNFIDTVTVKLRKKKIDSLIINTSVNDVLHLNDTLFLTTTNPVVNIDKSKFLLATKDSIKIPFDIKKETINKIALLFDKKPKESYQFTVLPKAITDVYKKVNDTLNYNFNTKNPSDYGTILLRVQNEKNKPVILQLFADNNLVRTLFLNTTQKVEFNLLEPKEYSFKAIIDVNKNKVWDTGNLLKKIQPEQILYYPKKIQLRANWTIDNTSTKDAFIIK